ncbi:MAG: OsmC family protein [Bacteriovorax sp.]|nr:OsmC family protein [Bacteriovorax sp.]
MDLNLKWHMGLNFTSQIRGHEVPIDAGFSIGGTDRGPTPKELVLTGIAGCSAMDAITYLKKYKMTPLDLNVETVGEQTDSTPKYFSKIHLKFKFLGTDLNEEKVIKSVETSMTKYCGVSYMLSKTAGITYDVELNGKTIFSGISSFSI